MILDIVIDDHPHHLELQRAGGRFAGKLDGKEIIVDVALVRPGVLSLLLGSESFEVKREGTGADAQIWVNGACFRAEVRDPRSLRARAAHGQIAGGPKKLTAPMPGKVLRVLVQKSEQVEAGQAVMVVEAMKMQNELKSPKTGTIQKIMAAEGATVIAGDTLLVVD